MTTTGTDIQSCVAFQKSKICSGMTSAATELDTRCICLLLSGGGGKKVAMVVAARSFHRRSSFNCGYHTETTDPEPLSTGKEARRAGVNISS
jgi:hypothetical protein